MVFFHSRQTVSGSLDLPTKLAIFTENAKTFLTKATIFYNLLVLLHTYMSGLYIHIPFCRSRCIYCGFFSSTSVSQKSAYVKALCCELSLRRHELHQPVHTVYLGGGTPSLLSREELNLLFQAISKDYFDGELSHRNALEITMECNPDDVTDDFCNTLQLLPVNRISMGVQTFSNDRLRFLHRRHNADEVGLAVQRLRQAGIHNISIDLMFGFPNETLSEWHYDIDHALQLDVEHISAYSLMYEEGTPLFQLLKQGKVSETDEELYRCMFDLLMDELTNAGFEHYEISNFAKKGFRSIHNSNYWNGTPYIGIGAAAHSFNTSYRRWNVSNLSKYILSISNRDLPYEEEAIDPNTRYDDTIVTALRTCEGINIESMDKRHKQYLLKQAEQYLSTGLLRFRDNHLRLTRNGIYISDAIMADLMWED